MSQPVQVLAIYNQSHERECDSLYSDIIRIDISNTIFYYKNGKMLFLSLDNSFVAKKLQKPHEKISTTIGDAF